MHPAADTVSLRDLSTRLAACRLCDAAGEPVVPPPISAVADGQRALIIGQAPGVHEPVLGRPFAADAGRRLRRWFAPYGLEGETAFRAMFAMTAVMKCFPGRDATGRGDRRPSPGQLARCAPWTAAQIRLLDPELVIPVGGVAISRIVGAVALRDVVGARLIVDSRVVVCLPHPSGASGWLNVPANRELLAKALALIAAELGLAGRP
jgi:uracil-DNA glycosylase family 4